MIDSPRVMKIEETQVIELKVRKFGESLGVLLPDEAVERLGIAEGERLWLVEAGEGSYRLTPHDSTFARKMEKAAGIADRYENTLRDLAE
jgi:putative addiction module antidote